MSSAQKTPVIQTFKPYTPVRTSQPSAITAVPSVLLASDQPLAADFRLLGRNRGVVTTASTVYLPSWQTKPTPGVDSTPENQLKTAAANCASHITAEVILPSELGKQSDFLPSADSKADAVGQTFGVDDIAASNAELAKPKVSLAAFTAGQADLTVSPLLPSGPIVSTAVLACNSSATATLFTKPRALLHFGFADLLEVSSQEAGQYAVDNALRWHIIPCMGSRRISPYCWPHVYKNISCRTISAYSGNIWQIGISIVFASDQSTAVGLLFLGQPAVHKTRRDIA